MIKNKSIAPLRTLNTDIKLTWFALIVSAITSAMLGKDVLGRFTELLQLQAWTDGLIQLSFIIVIAFLLYGNFVYLFARLGRLKRASTHQPASRHELEELYTHDAPSLCVLVPSYKEDPEVIRKTLLSAALLDYPSKQVVLLIDNAANPSSREDQQLLTATQALPAQIDALLQTQASRLLDELNRFNLRSESQLDVNEELHNLAALYQNCANWLQRQADTFNIENHEDNWFVENILRIPAQLHQQRATDLLVTASTGQLDGISLPLEYTRLSKLFQLKISSFERKKYINLSQESNKAMNLNSYLGLMGHGAQEMRQKDGLHLITTKPGKGKHNYTDAEFVITLDADSLLKPDYALRLVSLMQQTDNQSIAVAQTPYSAFPHAPNELERTAGATTDIQYLVHQGFTWFNATFWVGANALLRKRALEDIAVNGEERGYAIRRYIQDRTVIEDTESSVDLVQHGWGLFNYPQRLAYSATPPDFGSLLIQRRRWANGGLIILPKLLRYLTGSNVKHRLGHAFMGIHYLTSLASINLGVLLLLALPFDESMRMQWLPLAALPYFMLYVRDLRQSGYKLIDFFRITALNLLLVPVNLGGVCKSIQQMILQQRTPFARTPKVASRTATPVFYLFATYGFLLFCVSSLLISLYLGHWLHAVFAATNGALLAYGVLRYIGLRETYEDILVAYLNPQSAITEEPNLNLELELETTAETADERMAG